MMRRALVITLGAILIGSALGQPASANARDPDGSRMQARQINPGSSTRDSLAPPRDSVDWHYFKLSSAKSITIDLSTSPNDATASLRITNAVGKSVGGTNTRNGRATLSQRFDPGVYYLSVSSSSSLKYTLSVK